MKIESTILSRIAERVRDEVDQQKTRSPLADVKRRVADAPAVRSFAEAISTGFGLIAEIKERSPSMGDMLAGNVAQAPDAYAKCGLVKAVSVLTNASDFGMTLDRLTQTRDVVKKPVLRKDFIIDEYQIYQARAYGADALLLMTQLLSQQDLVRFLDCTHALGMDALVECRSPEDIAKAPAATRIYGINSRDFLDKGERFEQSKNHQSIFGNAEDFTTDLAAFDNIELLPDTGIRVAESGISPGTICSVRDKGYNAALIGTDLLINRDGIHAALAAYEDVLG